MLNFLMVGEADVRLSRFFKRIVNGAGAFASIEGKWLFSPVPAP